MGRCGGRHRVVIAAMVVAAVCLVGFQGAIPARAAGVVTLNLYIGGGKNIFDLWKKAFLPPFTKRYPPDKAKMVELLHDNGAPGVYAQILPRKRAGRAGDGDRGWR